MQKGKFNILYDAGHGSSGKGAATTRLVDIYKVENCSTNNFPNAGHCQTGDIYVITEEGLERLGDIVPRAAATKVVNMNGEFEPISAHVPDGVRTINKITLSNGVTFRCTDVHMYYVWDSSSGTRRWVRSMDLDSEVHQFIFPKKLSFPSNKLIRGELAQIDRPNKVNLRLPSDEKLFAKLLGLLVGDGYYAGDTKVDIAFHSTQMDSLEVAKSAFTDMGVTNIQTYQVEGKDCVVLSVTQVSDLKRIFEIVGLERNTGADKTTPACILKSNRDAIAAYLSGLFDSDGSAKSDRITLANTSPHVIYDAQQLLYILGIHSNVSVYRDSRLNKNGSTRKPQYCLSICGRANMETFRDVVGFISNRKNMRLSECIANVTDRGNTIKLSNDLIGELRQYRTGYKPNTKTSFIKSLPDNVASLHELRSVCFDYHIVDILSLEREESEEEVYDLTVPGTHSYIANGAISHNTTQFGDVKFVAKAIPAAASLNMVGRGRPELWLGPGSAFFWEQLQSELAQTGYAGSPRLHIHERAVVCQDKHIEMEQPGSPWSTEHLASTMSGSGAAYSHKAMRQKDVTLARDKEELLGYVMKPNTFAYTIKSRLDSGESFLHEVSQGYALSIDYGTQYPMSTFRNCTPQQAMADMMVLPSMVGDVYMNVRSFPIRVGNVNRDGVQTGYSGDFCSDQVELTWEQVARGAEMPEGMAEQLAGKLEKTTVTKRTRRVATQSWSLLSESAKMCGATKVILNFPQYIHWSAHKVRGGETEFKNLHWKVREYIDRLESVTNLKVVMIGTGADHDDYIWRG